MPVKRALTSAMLFLAAATLRGEEVWTRHGFDYGLIRTLRIEVDLHTRFRTTQHMTNFQQGRSGAIVRWNALPRLTAIGGYYYGQQEDGRDEWTNFHRVFGGGEGTIYGGNKIRLTSRILVERFIANSGPDSNRYRQRMQLSVLRKVGPYLNSEVFFDNQGLLSARHGGGVRWKWSSWSWVEVGYLYDDRSPKLGPERHMVVTQFYFGRPKN